MMQCALAGSCTLAEGMQHGMHDVKPQPRHTRPHLRAGLCSMALLATTHVEHDTHTQQSTQAAAPGPRPAFMHHTRTIAPSTLYLFPLLPLQTPPPPPAAPCQKAHKLTPIASRPTTMCSLMCSELIMCMMGCVSCCSSSSARARASLMGCCSWCNDASNKVRKRAAASAGCPVAATMWSAWRQGPAWAWPRKRELAGES
jgi:hypothetical protein